MADLSFSKLETSIIFEDDIVKNTPVDAAGTDCNLVASDVVSTPIDVFTVDNILEPLDFSMVLTSWVDENVFSAGLEDYRLYLSEIDPIIKVVMVTTFPRKMLGELAAEMKKLKLHYVRLPESLIGDYGDYMFTSFPVALSIPSGENDATPISYPRTKKTVKKVVEHTAKFLPFRNSKQHRGILVYPVTIRPLHNGLETIYIAVGSLESGPENLTVRRTQILELNALLHEFTDNVMILGLDTSITYYQDRGITGAPGWVDLEKVYSDRISDRKDRMDRIWYRPSKSESPIAITTCNQTENEREVMATFSL